MTLASETASVIAAVADIAEGRAAQAIPVADRTAKEQHHAEMKVAAEGEGNGHPDPLTRIAERLDAIEARLK